MKKVLNFILKSSADPKKTSVTVKFALLATVPYIMQTLDLVCNIGEVCYDVEPSVFRQLFEAFALLVFYFLAFLSAAGTAYGAIRKLVRTFKGENRALNEL